MNIIFKNIKNILIVALIAVVVLMRSCQPDPIDLKEYIKIGSKEYEVLKRNKDTIINHVTDTIIDYVPKYIPVKSTDTVKIPIDVDTLSILKDYYTKYLYTDKVTVNEYGFGTITDTITQNRIVSRSILWDLEIPIIQETIIVKDPPKNQMYVGGGVGFGTPDFISNVNTGILWKTKNDKIYGLNVGLSNQPVLIDNISTSQLKGYIGGSIYWKIKLRKE